MSSAERRAYATSQISSAISRAQPLNASTARQAEAAAMRIGPLRTRAARVVPGLAEYEQLLLDRILAIEPVIDARSTFAIRTVLSRGPLPLDHWSDRR
ncbi:hypothetical protein [Saccharopolyspora shandongensis]|uniref:hypothetical protein n=1 Tax=Saccharopolyspora shandongensis TaxID=418495 RepID=UPI0033E4CEDE